MSDTLNCQGMFYWKKVMRIYQKPVWLTYLNCLRLIKHNWANIWERFPKNACIKSLKALYHFWNRATWIDCKYPFMDFVLKRLESRKRWEVEQKIFSLIEILAVLGADVLVIMTFMFGK